MSWENWLPAQSWWTAGRTIRMWPTRICTPWAINLWRTVLLTLKWRPTLWKNWPIRTICTLRRPIRRRKRRSCGTTAFPKRESSFCSLHSRAKNCLLRTWRRKRTRNWKRLLSSSRRTSASWIWKKRRMRKTTLPRPLCFSIRKKWRPMKAERFQR